MEARHTPLSEQVVQGEPPGVMGWPPGGSGPVGRTTPGHVPIPQSHNGHVGQSNRPGWDVLSSVVLDEYEVRSEPPEVVACRSCGNRGDGDVSGRSRIQDHSGDSHDVREGVDGRDALTNRSRAGGSRWR